MPKKATLLCRYQDTADKIIDRIAEIYDSYMNTAAEILEKTDTEDIDLVKEAVLVDKNFSTLNMMYVLMTEEEFAETFARVLTMDDCDVLGGLLNIENYYEERSVTDGTSEGKEYQSDQTGVYEESRPGIWMGAD